MAQNHQIKMSLIFDVNTSKAKASLQDLQKSLNGLTSSIGKGDLKLTTDVQEAYVAAEKLKRVLNESVNMNTGQFDLSKFQYQLKQSGMSVQSLSTDFAKAGSQGVQAFNSLASAVANAEIPTKRMHKVLDQMVKSFKDTMRWQISSSVVHGLTGALQSAYGYAQDLNKSLNDIRIVTGYNEEYMARFAKEANNAAKALSSTTNEYAKAALIFYQQGTLTDDQIAQRTEATIKMANVTGEAAKDISSYMTAIWNNFDDGTKSIEYYADAITALGAATASSSAEIATGMQQFAAIGKTVGLSYDYAASALATVVAATRQSEETVGTSFKTIFSRLQSLQLGETLEDETTLTKYTAALAKVGVDIKLGNGELKQMDDIIDELGNKWAQLNQEQKTALAYTVAGSRQYTNFISLMDNYETFKVNVEIATDAEGTLEEQQKIYAESWEAAANRVRAAAEGIFQDLIDDKFFIDLLNGAEKLLSMLDLFMDSIGGLPGVLSLVSSLMLKIFNSQITQTVRDIGYGLSHFLGIAQAQAGKTKTEFAQEAQQLTKKMRVDTVGDPMLNADLDSMSYRIQLEQEYIALESTLTDHQKEQYQIQLSLLDVMREQKKEKLEAMEAAKEEMQKAGIATVKGASIMPQDEFMPAAKEAWTLEHMDKLSDASAAEAAAREAAQGAFDSMAARQAQADAGREALEAAIIKRDELKIKHAAVSKSKGAGFGNTSKGQSGAEAEADKQLAREYQAAEKLVRTLETQLAQAESDLVTAQGEARAAQGAFYEALTTKMEVANEEMPEFNPVEQAKVGETLKKYIAYSTGRNDMLEKGIVDMLGGLNEISREGMTEEEYKKRLADIATELRDFQDDYYVELGENTQEVIDAIIEQLETNWNEDGMDISSEDIQKFTDRITTAREADVKKYRTGTTGKDGRIDRQGTAADIRAAMEKEQGVVFDDATFAEFEEGYQKYAKTVREVRRTTDKELEGIKNAYGELNKPPEKLYDFADRITGIAQGISNLSLAFNSIKGAWDAISNPDLSGWERFMAVFTALSTVVGSVMSAMQLLSKFKAAENEKTVKETLITWLNTIAQKANAKARKEGAEAADQQGDEIEETTRAKQKEIITDVVGEGVDKVTDSRGDVLKGAGKGTEAVVKTGGKGLAKGGQSLGAAFKSALPNLGPIIGGVALIAAAVLAIAATVTIIVESYKAAEKAAEKAEKQAESVRKAAEETKYEYQETINTISNYQDALNGIEKLTKGTQEWRDAIIESNDQARELIDKFGKDLSAGDYYFEDGQIKFKEGVLESLQEKEYETMMQAQAGADSASAIALQRRNEADKIEFARKNMRTGQAGEETWSIAGAAAGGAVAGAALGTLIPILGTLIGAGIGAAVGVIGGAIGTGIAGASSKAEEEALNKLTELYRKDNTIIDQMAQAQKSGQLSKFADQYGISEELANSLLKNKDTTEELIIQMAANANEMQLLRESIAANANAGKVAYDNAENQEYINARVANLMKDPTSEEYQAAQARIDKLFEGSNEDFWDLYLSEVIGDNENYRVVNQAGKGATLQEKDENGNWVTDETLGKNGLMEVDAIEALRNVLIADLSSETIESFDASAKQLTKSLEKAGIANKEVVKKAVKAQESGEAIDLSSLTKSQLDALNIDAIANEELAAAIEEAQKNAKTSWNNTLADFSYSTQEAVNKLDNAAFETTEQFTREQLKVYGTALDQLTRIGGDGVAQAFNDNLTQLLNTNKDAAYEIMSIISEIDWSNPEEGLWAFQNGLSDIGVQIDVMSWDIDELGKKFGDIDFSPAFIVNLDSVSTKLAYIAGTLSKMEYGTIISAEDYEKVPEEFKHLFIESITSTDKEKKYRFLGGVEDYTTTLQKGAENQIWDAFESNKKANIANLLKDYDFKNVSDWSFEKMQDFYSTIQNSEDLQDILGWSYADTILPENLGPTFTANYTNINNNKKAIEAAKNYIAATGGTAALEDQTFPMMQFYSEHYDQQTGKWDSVENAQEYQRYKALKYISDTYGYVESRIDLQGQKEGYKNIFDEAAGWKVSYDWQNYLPAEGDIKTLTDFYENWSGKEVSSEELESYMQRYADTLTSKTDLDIAKRRGLISDTAYDIALQGLNIQLEALKEQINIYEDEEAQINSINRSLDEQQEITEKLHGKAKLQSLEKELNLNKQLLFINKQGLAVAQQELQEKTAEFEEKAEDKGWGEEFINKIEYDEFGNIINWEELENYLLYNIGETAVDEFKVFKNEVTEAEGKVKKFTDGIKESENVINSYQASSAEAIAENYDFISNKQKELRAQVENYHNIVGLIGKSTLGIDNEILQEMNNSLTQITVAELQTSYDHYIQQQKNREKAEQDYLNNRNATTEDALEKAKNAEAQALAEMNSQWSAALAQASQTLQDNIALIMDSFEQSVAGIYGSFERMTEFYDQQSQLSNQYLTDYKKIYELNKLYRDIQNSIDNSDNVKSKQILNGLQSELNDLQENSIEMSQYDLDYLQRKYELKLAEIALEESQNIKNQVRLQKMANGSWGYVYTQDEELINKAQQEYEDKLFNLQDLNHNYLDTVSQQILSTQSEFEAAITEIYSAGLSPEEQKKRIEETVTFYKSRLEFLTLEFDKVIENNKGLQNMVDSFSQTLLGSLYPDYDSAEDIFNMFTKKLDGDNGLLVQLQKAANQYSSTITSIFDTLNRSMTDFTDDMQIEINKLVDSIKGLSLQMMSQYDLGLGFDRNQSINILETKAHYFADWDKYGNDFIKQMWNLAVGSGQLDASYGLFSSFDSGGYTGKWGPEGKLAVLHEKEIVLNAEDSQNLLHIMEIMDHVMKNIDISANAAASSQLYSPGIASSNSTLQQQVTIHAEFPEATNRHEIEAAFDSLINRASQFANRNR